MKYCKKLLLSFLALILLFQGSVAAMAVEQNIDEGLVIEVLEDDTYGNEDDEARLSEDEDLVVEVFNSELHLNVGWVVIDGERFFYNNNHQRHRGWLLDGSHWHFLNPPVGVSGHNRNRSEGAMLTGWLLERNNWYFLNPPVGVSGHNRNRSEGAMLTGWVLEGTNWYFLNPPIGGSGRNASRPHGAMLTGWLLERNNWYFLNPPAGVSGRNASRPHGAMLTGWLLERNNWYFLNPPAGVSGHNRNRSEGAMLTGWVLEGTNWYFLNPPVGVSGRNASRSHGAMLTGWLLERNSWYFLNPPAGVSGRNASRPYGAMLTGWLQRWNSWFFLNNSGRMQTDPTLVNGVWQSFHSNGVWRGQLTGVHNEIEATLQRLVAGRNNVGISYFCLATGRHISINGNRTFNAASTIKLPTHMMVAEAVHDGRLSWDQRITVTQADWFGGSGVLQNRIRVGQQMTLYEVMRHSIIYSDNLGHRMLTRTVIPDFQHDPTGLDNSRRQLTDAIFNRYLPGQRAQGRSILTPNQLTEIFRVLYQDRNSISGYNTIINHMMNTSWTNRFYTPLTSGHVAHTPGWTGTFSHDSGIFFTEHPYILVVMTDGAGGANFLRDVSNAVFRLHRNFE